MEGMKGFSRLFIELSQLVKKDLAEPLFFF
jgi:hypothetical protein